MEFALGIECILLFAVTIHGPLELWNLEQSNKLFMDLWNLEQSNKLSLLQGTVDFLNVKSLQFWPQINERYMSSTST